MGKKIINTICMVVLSLVLLAFIETPDNSGKAYAKVPLGVTPMLPDNQREGGAPYFDLKVKPSQKQTLLLELENMSEEEVHLSAELHNAVTGNDGRIEYAANRSFDEDQTVYNMKDIITVQDNVVIEPFEVRTLELRLTVPDEGFSGQLAGSIVLKELGVEKGMAANEYVVAILLQTNDQVVKPDITIDKVAVEAEEELYVKLYMRNNTPVYVNHMFANIYIYDNKEKSKLLLKASRNNLRMSPNGEFELTGNLNGDKLKKGEYLVRTEVRSDEEQWFFEQELVVMQNLKAEQELSKFKSILKGEKTLIKIMLFGVIAVAIICAAVNLMLAVMKDKKMEAELKEKLMQEMLEMLL